MHESSKGSQTGESAHMLLLLDNAINSTKISHAGSYYCAVRISRKGKSTRHVTRDLTLFSGSHSYP